MEPETLTRGAPPRHEEILPLSEEAAARLAQGGPKTEKTAIPASIAQIREALRNDIPFSTPVELKGENKGAPEFPASFAKIYEALKNDGLFSTPADLEGAAEEARSLAIAVYREELEILRAKQDAAQANWEELCRSLASYDGTDADRAALKSAMAISSAVRATLEARTSFQMLRARLEAPLKMFADLQPMQPMHAMLRIIHRAGLSDYLEQCQRTFGKLADVRAGQTPGERKHTERAWERLRSLFGDKAPLLAVPPKSLDEWPEWCLLQTTHFVYKRAVLSVLDKCDEASFRLALRAIQLERLLGATLAPDFVAHSSPANSPMASTAEYAEAMDAYLSDMSPNTMKIMMSVLEAEARNQADPGESMRACSRVLGEVQKEIKSSADGASVSDVLEFLDAVRVIYKSTADALDDPERRRKLLYTLLCAQFPGLYGQDAENAPTPENPSLAAYFKKMRPGKDPMQRLLEPEMFKELVQFMGPVYVPEDTPTQTSGFPRVAMNVLLAIRWVAGVAMHGCRGGPHLVIERPTEPGMDAIAPLVGITLTTGLLAVVTTNGPQVFLSNMLGSTEVQDPSTCTVFDLSEKGMLCILGNVLEATGSEWPGTAKKIKDSMAQNGNAEAFVTFGPEKTSLTIRDFFATFPSSLNASATDPTTVLAVVVPGTRTQILRSEVEPVRATVGDDYMVDATVLSCYVDNRNRTIKYGGKIEWSCIYGNPVFATLQEQVARYHTWDDFLSVPQGVAFAEMVESWVSAAPGVLEDAKTAMGNVDVLGLVTASMQVSTANKDEWEIEEKDVTYWTQLFLRETGKTGTKSTFGKHTRWSGAKAFFSFCRDFLLYVTGILGSAGLSALAFTMLPAQVRSTIGKSLVWLVRVAMAAVTPRPIEEFSATTYTKFWMVKEAVQAFFFPNFTLRPIRGGKAWVPLLINVLVPSVTLFLLSYVGGFDNAAALYAYRLTSQHAARCLASLHTRSPIPLATEAFYEFLIWNTPTLGWTPMACVFGISLLRLAWSYSSGADPEPRIGMALLSNPPPYIAYPEGQLFSEDVETKIRELDENIRGYMDALRDSGYSTVLSYQSINKATRDIIEYAELTKIAQTTKGADGTVNTPAAPWLDHFNAVAAPAIAVPDTLLEMGLAERNTSILRSKVVKRIAANFRPFVEAVLRTGISGTIERTKIGNPAVYLRHYYKVDGHIRDRTEPGYATVQPSYTFIQSRSELLTLLAGPETGVGNNEPRTPFERIPVRTELSESSSGGLTWMRKEEIELENDVARYFRRRPKFWWSYDVNDYRYDSSRVLVVFERPTNLLPSYALNEFSRGLFRDSEEIRLSFETHMEWRLSYTVVRTRIVRFCDKSTSVELSDVEELNTRFNAERVDITSKPYIDKSPLERLVDYGTTRPAAAGSGRLPRQTFLAPYNSHLLARLINDLVWSAFMDWSWTTEHLHDRKAIADALKILVPKLPFPLPDFSCVYRYGDFPELPENLESWAVDGPWYMAV